MPIGDGGTRELVGEVWLGREGRLGIVGCVPPVERGDGCRREGDGE